LTDCVLYSLSGTNCWFVFPWSKKYVLLSTVMCYNTQCDTWQCPKHADICKEMNGAPSEKVILPCCVSDSESNWEVGKRDPHWDKLSTVCCWKGMYIDMCKYCVALRQTEGFVAVRG
jgi:hypothetical protein